MEETGGSGESHFTIEYTEYYGDGGGEEVAESQEGASPIPGIGEATSTPSPGGGSPTLGTGEATPTSSPTWKATPASATSNPTSSIHFVSPLANMSPYVNAKHDGKPLRFWAVDDIIGDESPPRQAVVCWMILSCTWAALRSHQISRRWSKRSAGELRCWRRWRRLRNSRPGSLSIRQLGASQLD